MRIIKIKKTSIIFIGIAILIFIGAMNKYLTYAALASAVICAIGILDNNEGRFNPAICNGILFLLIAQNFCIGMGAHITGNTDSSLKLLTQIPFLVVAIIWFYGFFVQKEKAVDRKIVYSFYILLTCIVFSCFMGRGGFQSAMVSARNMTIFFMAYEMGARNLVTDEKMKKTVRFMVISGILLTLIGLIIQLGGYELYKRMGIHEVYIAKAAAFGKGSLDGRFYTSLFRNVSYVRMGSLYYEPVNLAYYLAMSFLCALYKNPWHSIGMRIGSISIIGFGLIATFGKGGYMIVGVTIICVSLETFFKKIKDLQLIKNILPKIIVIVSATMVVIFVLFYVKHIGLAVMNHIWGIQQTWENVLKQPIGYGLGTGGNAAYALGGLSSSWFAAGGETALMSFMYQIGMQGVFAFVLCFVYMSKSRSIRKTKFEKMFYYIPFIILGVSLLQDNTYTPQCIIPFMLLQGATGSTSKQKIYKGGAIQYNEQNKNYSNVLASIPRNRGQQ